MIKWQPRQPNQWRDHLLKFHRLCSGKRLWRQAENQLFFLKPPKSYSAFWRCSPLCCVGVSHILRCSPRIEFQSSKGAFLQEWRLLRFPTIPRLCVKSIFPMGWKLLANRYPAFHKSRFRQWSQNGFLRNAKCDTRDFYHLRIAGRYRPCAPIFLGQQYFRPW